MLRAFFNKLMGKLFPPGLGHVRDWNETERLQMLHRHNPETDINAI
jgi:hypothetical protein